MTATLASEMIRARSGLLVVRWLSASNSFGSRREPCALRCSQTM